MPLVGPLKKVGVSRKESVTQPGSLWNAQLGGVSGPLAVVAQFVPSAQVPVGVQLAGPGVKEVVQPEGSAGAMTPSKASLKATIKPHGVGVGVAVGIGVSVGVGVGVGVGDGGVGVAVGGGGEGGGLGHPGVGHLDTINPPARSRSAAASRQAETQADGLEQRRGRENDVAVDITSGVTCPCLPAFNRIQGPGCDGSVIGAWIAKWPPAAMISVKAPPLIEISRTAPSRPFSRL